MKTIKKKKVQSGLVPDWEKKAAAQAALQATTDQTEQAFLDMAYTQMSNKCQSLMQKNYRVGFEVIQNSKSDDNTRMVGVFVFRVKKSILLVPILYLNGATKGCELLYIVDKKRFVPLSNDWVNAVIAQSESPSDGEGVPMAMRQQAHDQLHLERLAVPPASYLTHKWASSDESKQLIQSHLPALLKAASEHITTSSSASSSILRHFIQEDGGRNAIQKIANTAKENFKFANALFVASDENNYMPEIDDAPPQEDPTYPVLTLRASLFNSPGIKSASEKDMENGYNMDDKRPAEATNDVIYADASEELESISEPGIYEVLVNDGSTRSMLVAYPANEEDDLFELNGCTVNAPKAYRPSHRNPEEQNFVVVDMGDKQSCKSDQQIIGKMDKEIPVGIGDESPKASKAYRVYCSKNKSLTIPFLVKKVETEAGLKKITACRYSTLHDTILTLNPDYDGHDYEEKVLGKCCRFVEVAMEKKDKEDYFSFPCNIVFGDKYALDKFVYENGYKRASVVKTPSGGYLFRDSHQEQYKGEMGKLACKCYLMGACSLTEKAADNVLSEVEDSPMNRMNFLWQEKKAYNLRFSEFPTFPENMNTEYGVAEQPADLRYLVTAQRDIPVLPKQRIGDRYSEETADTIDTMAPMDLYNLSKEKGMPNMFEHGVVGSLINTYDSSAVIEKYIPEMETALDRLGRILFLFYWKPDDFVKAFGSDDQDQLESKLISNFKSLGALVLELKQKNSQYQSGSSALT